MIAIIQSRETYYPSLPPKSIIRGQFVGMTKKEEKKKKGKRDEGEGLKRSIRIRAFPSTMVNQRPRHSVRSSLCSRLGAYRREAPMPWQSAGIHHHIPRRNRSIRGVEPYEIPSTNGLVSLMKQASRFSGVNSCGGRGWLRNCHDTCLN